MFSPSRTWSHRLRLTALLTVTVSVALGLVFLLVIFIVRNQAMGRRFSELQTNVSRVAIEFSDPQSLAEEKEDFPDDTFSVYTLDAHLIASSSKNPPRFLIGTSWLSHQLAVGIRVGNRVFVGNSSWRETAAGLRQLAFVLALLWLPLTLVTAIVAWYGGGLVLRPVTELVTSAEKLSGKPDGRMLTTTDHAEFATLAESLNQLIARIHTAASVQEQFAADAAHELRNPLAMLRMRVESNLLKDRTVKEHVRSQEKMLNQIDRLTNIVEALLLSARQSQVAAEVVELDSLVIQAVADWADLTAWPLDRIHVTVSPCMARVTSDEIALILRNLLDNASRYSTDFSPIDIQVGSHRGWSKVEVRDYGTGIPSEDLERVFDRFYRTDTGRARSEGGNGIGLSVIKRLVESRGGVVRAENVPRGTLILVLFPAPY